MRIAYLDCSAGISGDMLLGALIDAGAPADQLHGTLRALNIGATLEIEQVDRAGIAGTHARIMVGDHVADSPHHHHDHASHRSLAEISRTIQAARLPKAVSAPALRAFELLGHAEAKVHGIPVEKVHFHEVGAVDAIADIVLTSAAAHALEIETWYATSLNVGTGTVECAHGRYPVPAPATAELLRGVPLRLEGIGEMVTPTGAALLRAFDCHFGPMQAVTFERHGYGAGTRNPPGFANAARLSLGAITPTTGPGNDVVTILETALDDCSPQVIAYFTERALALGALDVLRTPVFMKKNRSGTLLTVLCHSDRASALQDLLLRETSTLGLRVREERRICLERTTVEVQTSWGLVRVKVGRRTGEEMNAAPEFMDCRELADKHGVPLARVQEAALLAYRRGSA